MYISSTTSVESEPALSCARSRCSLGRCRYHRLDPGHEAIKLLLGLGDPLDGRLLAYDSLEQAFRTFKGQPGPGLPAAGDGATITIADYDEFCMPHATLADGTTVGH